MPTRVEAESRLCPVCGESKAATAENFYRRSERGGFRPRCKVCDKKKTAAWVAAKPERAKEAARRRQRRYVKNNPGVHRKHWLSKKYGMTVEQYQGMLADQGGRCAACKRTPEESGQTGPHAGGLCVDHCHTTGHVRGLLCHHCNTALGHVEESAERLFLLVAYLLRAGEPRR